MRLQDIPTYDHSLDTKKDFRTKVLERIGKKMGGYALVDPDIAFESVSSNPTREELDVTLAEFRRVEEQLPSHSAPETSQLAYDTNQLELF